MAKALGREVAPKTRKRKPFDVASVYLVVGVTCFLVLSLPVLAQVRLSKSTKAAHELFLQGYAQTDSNCASVEPPAINLDQPPEHGIVCSRRGYLYLRNVEDGNLAHCLRRKAFGVHVLYLPRKGYAGKDEVRYTVQFPGTQHKVQVNLTVLPDEPQSRTAVPGDISAPDNEIPQLSGPIPVCTALVS
jgi:hypothetical protein